MQSWSAMLFTLALLAAGAAAQETAPVPPEAPPATQPAAGESTTLTAEQALEQARLLIEQKNFAAAQTLLNVLLTRDPKYTDAKLVQAELAEAQNDSVTARDIYKDVLRTDPSNFTANLAMGKSYALVRWWRQAVPFLENASRVAPPDKLGEALGFLAAAYRGEGQLTKASETAERAVKQAPDSTDALAIQVSIQLDLQQYDRAVENAAKLEQIARRKLGEDPTNVKLINGLQEAYIIQIETLRGAHLALYRKDARGVPTDRLVVGKEAEAGALLSQLSDVMTKQLEIRRLMGLYEILPIAERITTYTPNDANAHVRLGFLCVHTSQTERAVAAFQRALEIQPDHPEALEMLRRFNAPTTRPAQAAATP